MNPIGTNHSNLNAASKAPPYPLEVIGLNIIAKQMRVRVTGMIQTPIVIVIFSSSHLIQKINFMNSTIIPTPVTLVFFK